MTINLKDVAGVASAGMTIQSRLILFVAVIVLAGLAALALASHYEGKGRTLERAEWLEKEGKRDLADAALIRKHEAEMSALEQTHRLIERKTTHDHQTELATLRSDRAADRAAADRAGGLRIPAPTCPAGSTVAGTEAPGAGGRDDAPGAGTVRLPHEVENDLWAIADDADEVSAQLRACQSWVRANGFYGPATTESGALLDRMIASPNQPNPPEEPHG